jgi:arylsulfatase A-like enzyme
MVGAALSGHERPGLRVSRRARSGWSSRAVGGALVALPLAACAGFPDGTQPRPNVILVSIDTLRADHLGMYGYARDTSPSLDRLARKSTLFLQAVAQAPNTSPSQMALLTSLYYSVHGLTGRDDRLPESRVTLAELLRSHGYATWGFVDGGLVRAVFGFAQGFDHYEDEPVRIKGILANFERWLDTHPERPFFLFLHCYDVHAPYAPPPPYDTLFEETPYTGDFIPTAENLAAVAQWRRNISAEDLRHVVALYDGGIRYTDDQLGTFFENLGRRGLLNSTIVIVTSDHGEEFQEHGSMLHWQTHFAPNLHVVLFFHIPGHSPRTVEGPVELVDVLPTVLDLLGLPPHPAAMGRTLVPLIDGREARSERVAYAEPFLLNVPHRTIVSDRYQLHHNTRSGEKRLFDIRKDPGATVDLAHREPEVTARLMEALEERQRRITTAKAHDGGASEPVVVDEDTKRQLRALGYVQ